MGTRTFQDVVWGKEPAELFEVRFSDRGAQRSVCKNRSVEQRFEGCFTRSSGH